MVLHKILKIVALVLSVIAIILFGMLLVKGDEVVKATGEGLNPYMFVAYAMMAIILFFTVVFAIKGVFQGNVKKTLLSLGVLLVVFVFSYVLSDNNVEGLPLVDGEIITPSASKWVGTGLYAFYILAIVAIGATALGGIKKLTTK